MKQRYMSILAVILVLIVGAGVAHAVNRKSVAETYHPTPPSVNELWTFTNAARQQNGLQPLPLDPRLNTSAQLKADDETKFDYFSHYNPTTKFQGLQYVFQTWSDCAIAGENLADNTVDSKSTIDGLMNSPVHREVLLSPKDIAVGFGISGHHIVQHFCQAN